MDFLLVND